MSGRGRGGGRGALRALPPGCSWVERKAKARAYRVVAAPGGRVFPSAAAAWRALSAGPRTGAEAERVRSPLPAAEPVQRSDALTALLTSLSVSHDTIPPHVRTLVRAATCAECPHAVRVAAGFMISSNAVSADPVAHVPSRLLPGVTRRPVPVRSQHCAACSLQSARCGCWGPAKLLSRPLEQYARVCWPRSLLRPRAGVEPTVPVTAGRFLVTFLSAARRV
jgi:hypothetical protein